MAQWVALAFAVVVFVAACCSLVLRWDLLLFVARPKFSLSTLLILLGVMPPLIATAWLNRDWALPTSLVIAAFVANWFFYFVMHEPGNIEVEN